MNLPNHATNETLSRKGSIHNDGGRTKHVGIALDGNYTTGAYCDGHGARAHRTGDGGVGSVAFYAEAVRNGHFRHSSGLTVDGDRSGESELGTGGHYVDYFKFDC